MRIYLPFFNDQILREQSRQVTVDLVKANDRRRRLVLA